VILFRDPGNGHSVVDQVEDQVLLGWVELGVVADADPAHPPVLDGHFIRPVGLDDAGDLDHRAGFVTADVGPTVAADRSVEGNCDHRGVAVAVLDRDVRDVGAGRRFGGGGSTDRSGCHHGGDQQSRCHHQAPPSGVAALAGSKIRYASSFRRWLTRNHAIA